MEPGGGGLDGELGPRWLRIAYRLDQHRAVIEQAFGRSGEFRLRRGFHADVTLDQALSSFVADGFVPAPLVLDA